jgi:hypothetical protein
MRRVLPLLGTDRDARLRLLRPHPEFKGSPVIPRNMSLDGERFFFQTPDPLVGADVNASSGCSLGDAENASCMDVYEWEAPGTGSCPATTANLNGGCLYLISSGRSEQASYFADADREGRNVYFFTTSQLVPSDGDHLFDVYDAREAGGLVSQHELPTPACVSRQACQGQQVGAESPPTPGSATFVGPQNPGTPTACKKGRVRTSGKCVKPKQRKKRHHQKKKRAGHGAGGKGK